MNNTVKLIASVIVLVTAMVGLWAAIPYSGWVLLTSIIGFLSVIDEE